MDVLRLLEVLKDVKTITVNSKQTFYFDRQSDAGSLFHLPVAEPLKEARWHQVLFGVCVEEKQKHSYNSLSYNLK